MWFLVPVGQGCLKEWQTAKGTLLGGASATIISSFTPEILTVDAYVRITVLLMLSGSKLKLSLAAPLSFLNIINFLMIVAALLSMTDSFISTTVVLVCWHFAYRYEYES